MNALCGTFTWPNSFTEVVKKEEEGVKVEEPVAPLAGNGGRL